MNIDGWIKQGSLEGGSCKRTTIALRKWWTKSCFHLWGYKSRVSLLTSLQLRIPFILLEWSVRQNGHDWNTIYYRLSLLCPRKVDRWSGFKSQKPDWDAWQSQSDSWFHFPPWRGSSIQLCTRHRYFPWKSSASELGEAWGGRGFSYPIPSQLCCGVLTN